MLIAFSGPQCSGKSTLLEECRSQFAGKYTYEREIARTVQQIGGKINEDGDDIGQLLIINTHLQNSLKKNTIVDRCIIDAKVYSIYSCRRKKISDWVMQYCNDVYNLIINKYDIIFYTDPGIPLKEDGVRSSSVEFRNEISEIFENILQEHFKSGLAIRLEGSVQERMERVRRSLQIKK